MPLKYPFNRVLEVMKPCKIKTDNSNHLLRLEDALKDTSNYIAEEKIDGCHYLAINGRFFSTRISEYTGWPVEKTDVLSHISDLLKPYNKLILDGEIYYPGMKSQDVISITGSHPDVALMKQREQGFVRYIVFDCLRTVEGEWLVNRPWIERRTYLESVHKALKGNSQFIDLIRAVKTNKQQFMNEVLQSGLEGIVLKDIYATYIPGKRPMWNWIKVKQEDEDDVVVMGFEPATRIYTGTSVDSWPWWENDPVLGESVPITRLWANGWIGAIIFGKYNPSTQAFERLGTCSGIEDASRQQFSNNPDAYIGKVIKIKYMEKTRDGAYRHPNFVSLHSDKNPQDCIIDL